MKCGKNNPVNVNNDYVDMTGEKTSNGYDARAHLSNDFYKKSTPTDTHGSYSTKKYRKRKWLTVEFKNVKLIKNGKNVTFGMWCEYAVRSFHEVPLKIRFNVIQVHRKRIPFI